MPTKPSSPRRAPRSIRRPSCAASAPPWWFRQAQVWGPGRDDKDDTVRAPASVAGMSVLRSLCCECAQTA